MGVVWLNAGLLISIQPLPSLSNPNPIYSKKTEDKVTLWGRVQQEQGWTNSQHPLASDVYNNEYHGENNSRGERGVQKHS